MESRYGQVHWRQEANFQYGRGTALQWLSNIVSANRPSWQCANRRRSTASPASADSPSQHLECKEAFGFMVRLTADGRNVCASWPTRDGRSPILIVGCLLEPVNHPYEVWIRP